MKLVNKVSLGLTLLGLVWFGAVCRLKTHDAVFMEEGLLRADASELKHTRVTPHLETPITIHENVLWCGTFQLAWNEACSLVGEDLHFDNEPAMVEILNRRSFTAQDIDTESYVAVAGFVKDAVHDQIAQELQNKFRGQAVPRYIPPKHLTPRPQDIVAYSYLFKSLEFRAPFERIEKPITFERATVPCFGIGAEWKEKHAEMLEQFVILDYQDRYDFVIEFKTNSEGDRLILAKMQPEATLDATVRAVQKRAANPEPMQPQVGDVLKVPKLNFDVTRRYAELEGKKLVASNPKIASDLRVLSALQNVRFQFDEKGVQLRSESHVAFGCAAPPPPPPGNRTMIFDSHFLIMLQRTEADVPYFALWVGNPELLVKLKE